MQDTTWSAQEDEQAIGRILRYGQTRDVIIYRLIALGSADIILNNISFSKGMMHQAFVDSSFALSKHQSVPYQHRFAHPFSTVEKALDALISTKVAGIIDPSSIDDRENDARPDSEDEDEEDEEITAPTPARSKGKGTKKKNVESSARPEASASKERKQIEKQVLSDLKKGGKRAQQEKAAREKAAAKEKEKATPLQETAAGRETASGSSRPKPRPRRVAEEPQADPIDHESPVRESAVVASSATSCVTDVRGGPPARGGDETTSSSAPSNVAADTSRSPKTPPMAPLPAQWPHPISSPSRAPSSTTIEDLTSGLGTTSLAGIATATPLPSASAAFADEQGAAAAAEAGSAPCGDMDVDEPFQATGLFDGALPRLTPESTPGTYFHAFAFGLIMTWLYFLAPSTAGDETDGNEARAARGPTTRAAAKREREVNANSPPKKTPRRRRQSSPPHSPQSSDREEGSSTGGRPSVPSARLSNRGGRAPRPKGSASVQRASRR